MTKVQVLGPGCMKCRKVAENAAEAVRQLGLECEIEKVTDIMAIMGYGVMVTPGIAVNGVVKMTGRIPTVEEIKGMLA